MATLFGCFAQEGNGSALERHLRTITQSLAVLVKKVEEMETRFTTLRLEDSTLVQLESACRAAGVQAAQEALKETDAARNCFDPRTLQSSAGEPLLTESALAQLRETCYKAGADAARAALKESEISRARLERNARTERDTVNAQILRDVRRKCWELSHLCGWQKRTIANQARALASWQNCWWQVSGSFDVPVAPGKSAEKPLPPSSHGEQDYCVLGGADYGDDPCDDVAGWTEAAVENGAPQTLPPCEDIAGWTQAVAESGAPQPLPRGDDTEAWIHVEE